MYTRVSVNNFRILARLRVDDLKPISLIGGKNNSGKSAFLEALFLLLGTTKPTFAQLSGFRGIHGFEGENVDAVRSLVWNSLFLGFDTGNKIEIVGTTPDNHDHRLEVAVEPTDQLHEVWYRNGTRRLVPLDTFSASKGPTSLRVSFKDGGRSREVHYILDDTGFKPIEVQVDVEPIFKGVYIHPSAEAGLSQTAEQLGELEILGEKERLVGALRLLEPRLRDLSVIVRAGLPMIHGHLEDESRVPLALMGGGIGRLTMMLLAIPFVKGGIALIDEIENGLHNGILRDVWRVLSASAKLYDVQIVATTHSLECIRAAHEALSETIDYPFGLFRFDVIDGLPRCVAYDRETLDAAVKAEIEVR